MRDGFFTFVYILVMMLALLTSPIGMLVGAVGGAFYGLYKGFIFWMVGVSHVVFKHPR